MISVSGNIIPFVKMKQTHTKSVEDDWSFDKLMVASKFITESLSMVKSHIKFKVSVPCQLLIAFCYLL